MNSIKILCVSDQVDPLIYSSNLKKAFSDVDLILCAGDLPMEYIDFIVSTLNKPAYFIFGNHHVKEFAHYHRTVNSLIDISGTGISRAGHGAVYVGFKNIRDYNFSVVNPATGKKTPLLISGASGSMRYNKGQGQYTDSEMFFHLIRMSAGLLWNKLRYGRAVDIFLTHAPPQGIHDRTDICHRGFRCFLWFMKKFKPKKLVHGHIHIYDTRTPRESVCGETDVVNVFGHYILNYPMEKI